LTPSYEQSHLWVNYYRGDRRFRTGWYIQSFETADQKPYSCSFVEFDERGDYLDFQQHRQAYLKIKELAQKGERLLVLIYVHGWKNNSQSGDVVEFNNFLSRVATSPLAREGRFRVHGVYLAWRGNSLKHALDSKSPRFEETRRSFGEPIVNLQYARKAPLGWLLWVPEQLSYWSRKNAAEDKVSGISLIRTIFTCGYTARRYGSDEAPNRVFLMGHSFGALMLEQSFAPASLSRLTAEWPFDDDELIKTASANPLPFDLVLFVNSAAPSIYAKQFHDYMVAHRGALVRKGIVGAEAPLVISLTSSADSATGKIHRWGNFLAPLYPSLWRNYDGKDFILAVPSNSPSIKVPQAYYYQHTPGHNPLLVNHWIAPVKEEAEQFNDQNLVHQNLDLKRDVEIRNRTFQTSPRKKGGKQKTWQITRVPPDPEWSKFHGYKAIASEIRIRSGYWIVRCEKEIISSHNDVWSQQAMETYAALLRETEFLRSQKPNQNTSAIPEPSK
jgi:hypothetical protein